MIDPHFHTLIFNGVDLADFGVHVSGNRTYGAPEYDYEIVEVPGRSGDLHINKNRFKNITVSYDAWIGEDLENNLTQLRNFLLTSRGYKRIEDTYHPDEYRLGTFTGPIDPEIINLTAATFTLEFNCKPQRFLKIGEETKDYTHNFDVEHELAADNGSFIVTNTGEIIVIHPNGQISYVITNETFHNAKPIFRVYGTGRINVSSALKSYSFVVAPHSGIPYIDVDCDICNCQYDTTNCNSYVTFNDYEFPEFVPGQNYLMAEMSIDKIVITPRWWIV